MTPATWKKFEELERRKRIVLADVAGLSRTQLQFRPEAAGWSVLEILDHLTKVEEASLQAVLANLPGGAKMTLRDRAGAWLITCIMLSPMRVKVPVSAARVLPEATADLAGIHARWSVVREQMASLLGSLRAEQFRVGLFRHPVSGWMTITDTLMFLCAHLQHHRYQLRRLTPGTRQR